MSEVSVKYINKMIDKAVEAGKEPTKLLLGYKTFPLLLNDEKFQKDLSSAGKNGKDKFYKKLKIKLVTEKDFCDIE